MEIYKEDYPCSFCGYIDGEHANGCPYNDYDYPQDVKPQQEKSTAVKDPTVCPKCGSSNIRHLALNIMSDKMYRCLYKRCTHEWDLNENGQMIELSEKLQAHVIHSPEHWNPTCQATIPEYWEAELLNIPEEISNANTGNLRIYGTSQESGLDAVSDLISELKSINLTGSIKIIR